MLSSSALVATSHCGLSVTPESNAGGLELAALREGRLAPFSEGFTELTLSELETSGHIANMRLVGGAGETVVARDDGVASNSRSGASDRISSRARLNISGSSAIGDGPSTEVSESTFALLGLEDCS